MTSPGNNGPLTALTKRTRGDPGNKSVCLSTTDHPCQGTFVTQRAVRTFKVYVHGVPGAVLSKCQKRADLKENLSSKRDTASIVELRWKDRNSSVL